MTPGRRFIEIFRPSTVYSPGVEPRESELHRFWRESLSKAIIPMIAILCLITFLKSIHFFDRLEAVGLDYLVRSQVRLVPTDIFLVKITDEDYKTYFNAKSPLDPTQVLNLIDAVQSAEPAVIGMDIDTRGNDWRAQCIWKLPEYQKILDPNSNVVWALVPSGFRHARPHNGDSRILSNRYVRKRAAHQLRACGSDFSPGSPALGS